MFRKVNIKIYRVSALYYYRSTKPKLTEVIANPVKIINENPGHVNARFTSKNYLSIDSNEFRFIGALNLGFAFLYLPNNVFYMISPHDYSSVENLIKTERWDALRDYPVDRIFATGTYSNFSSRGYFSTDMVITEINDNHFMCE